MIGVVMRVARPTDNLEAIARMYSAGLGFEQLGAFVNHRGFDGVILGHPRAPYHLEFIGLVRLFWSRPLFALTQPLDSLALLLAQVSEDR